jgi:hypothetical protein
MPLHAWIQSYLYVSLSLSLSLSLPCLRAPCETWTAFVVMHDSHTLRPRIGTVPVPFE